MTSIQGNSQVHSIQPIKSKISVSKPEVQSPNPQTSLVKADNITTTGAKKGVIPAIQKSLADGLTFVGETIGVPVVVKNMKSSKWKDASSFALSSALGGAVVGGLALGISSKSLSTAAVGVVIGAAFGATSGFVGSLIAKEK